MNRREFLRLGLAGLAGAFIPKAGYELVERLGSDMQIGNILAKLGEGKTLSQNELQELRLWGNHTQTNNVLVDQWATLPFTQDDPSNMQLSFRTLGAKLSRTGSYSIAHDTNTYVPFTTIDYYSLDMVDIVSNPTRITIPKTGRWVVGINVAFGQIASGYWSAWIVVNRTYALAAGAQSQAVGFGALNFPEDAILNKGDYVELRVYQSSGGSLNINGENMYVRWLGEN